VDWVGWAMDKTVMKAIESGHLHKCKLVCESEGYTLVSSSASIICIILLSLSLLLPSPVPLSLTLHGVLLAVTQKKENL
jgi:hypothetical protein